MKQFLLLAAIYSLVIHQSRKNSREAIAELRQPTKKVTSSSGLSNARFFAFNTLRLGSGISNSLYSFGNPTNTKWLQKK